MTTPVNEVAPQPEKHAVLGFSSAYAWRACPAKVAMEQHGQYPDKVGSNAKRGTFMHHVAAFCLTQFKSAKEFIGYQENVEGEDFTFDEEMAALVQTYVDTVLTYKGDTGLLFVEVQLDIAWITGEEDAVGTADAVVIRDGELIVIDLKTGHNNVDAAANDQLLGYAAAALKMHNEGRLAQFAVGTIEGPFYWSHPESGSYGICNTRAEINATLDSDPLVVEISRDDYVKLVDEANKQVADDADDLC